MTKEEFRMLLMRQGKQGAAGDNIVDACMLFQMEYGTDVLDLQSTRFDLMVAAHNERARQQKEAYAGVSSKKRFGYD